MHIYLKCATKTYTYYEFQTQTATLQPQLKIQTFLNHLRHLRFITNIHLSPTPNVAHNMPGVWLGSRAFAVYAVRLRICQNIHFFDECDENEIERGGCFGGKVVELGQLAAVGFWLIKITIYANYVFCLICMVLVDGLKKKLFLY